jgi:hypothetical protein
VGEDEREGVRLRRADVQEMDVLPIDRRRELLMPVELRLPLAPVVLRAPTFGERLHTVERHAVAVSDAGKLIGPAGPREPVTQVIEVRLRNLDPERPDLVAPVAHRVPPSPARRDERTPL